MAGGCLNDPPLPNSFKIATDFKASSKPSQCIPMEAISLRTSSTGRIDLGQDRGRLNEQIDAIVQLRRTLPPELLKPNQGYLDLTNPDRPELQLPVTSVPAEEAPIP
jgi:cell division protein FtsQ